jgi:hypothetical protein
MRLTHRHLILDPQLVIRALEAQGIAGAEAKVMGLARRSAQIWNLENWLRGHDLRYQERRGSLKRMLALRNRTAIQRRRWKSRLAERDSRFNHNDVILRGVMKRMIREMERRLARWPDLPLREEDFPGKPNALLIRRLLRGSREIIG